MQKDGLEIRLVYLDAVHGDAGFARRGEDLGQSGTRAFDQKLHRAIGHRDSLNRRYARASFRRGLQRAAAGELHLVVLSEQRHQLLARAFRLELTVVDDPDPVAEPLGLLHVMGRVEDGHTLTAQLLDRLEDGVPALWIEPD